MELELDVKINASELYNYMMHHTYSCLSGLIGTTVGALLVCAFFMGYGMLYLIFGGVIIAYLPISLFTRSRQQALRNPAFREPLHYRLCEEGIEVSQQDEVQMTSWDMVVKAVSTTSSYIIYTSKINAFILPKKDMGEKTSKVLEMIATHIPPSRNKIRA